VVVVRGAGRGPVRRFGGRERDVGARLLSVVPAAPAGRDAAAVVDATHRRGHAAFVGRRRARAAAVDRLALSPRAARGQRTTAGPGAGPGDPEAAPVGSP